MTVREYLEKKKRKFRGDYLDAHTSNDESFWEGTAYAIESIFSDLTNKTLDMELDK